MPIQSKLTTLLFRAVFVLSTGALLVATHWPGLAVKSSFSRMDLVIHACVFCCWTVLLGLTGWIRVPRCPKRRALVLVMIGIAFGLFDETTQPLFSRVFDPLDLAADSLGAIVGGVTMLIVWTRSSRSNQGGTPDSLARQAPDTRS